MMGGEEYSSRESSKQKYLLKEMLRIHPNHIPTLLEMGNHYYFSGFHEKSLIYYNRVINLGMKKDLDSGIMWQEIYYSELLRPFIILQTFMQRKGTMPQPFDIL